MFVHPILLWVAEHAGFLLWRFEVGQDGKTANERLTGKPATVQGGRNLVKELTCWRSARNAYMHVGGRRVLGWSSKQKPMRGTWPTRTVSRKWERARCNRDNLSTIVGVPWRKNDDDSKMDDEGLKDDVVMMDPKRGPEPKRAHITREDLEHFGFTAMCPGCVSMPRGITEGGSSREANEGVLGQDSRERHEEDEVSSRRSRPRAGSSDRTDG